MIITLFSAARIEKHDMPAVTITNASLRFHYAQYFRYIFILPCRHDNVIALQCHGFPSHSLKILRPFLDMDTEKQCA